MNTTRTLNSVGSMGINDAVTFTITLPTVAPLKDHVEALENAITAQHAAGNAAAAQALAAIAVLARRGLISFEAGEQFARS